MTRSFSSRNLSAPTRQPVRTAHLLCDRTAAYGVILQWHLLAPDASLTVLIPYTPATANTIQNA